jgi:acetylornithine/N-succinyldiaminopimelate aminotransferase
MISQREFFLRHIAQTSDIPLGIEVERAEGCYLMDVNGKKYLDLISGIGVSNLGHGHPAIIKAIKEQVDKHLHLMVYGEYIQSPQNKLAKLLIDNLPTGLDTVYFTNSGTEATEGAMKLAKRHTGRSGFISFDSCYHGSTQGALSLAGGEWLQNGYTPLLPNCTVLKYNDIACLEKINTATAAVFVEPIQGEAGARAADPEFLSALRQRCTDTGVLLVFDEIQCGMGRTGTLWAHEKYGVIPDIILLGKALGGGMPLGAFISSNEIMSKLSYEPVLGHITTFGGHPLSCTAGYAALDILLSSGLVGNVIKKEEAFRKALQHPNIKAIHGKGLLLSMELKDFGQVQKVIRHCIEHWIITDWFLYNDNCIRIAPPLTISIDEIVSACGIIIEGVNSL